MNIIGIIPARAGSTRVPRKNIRRFGGGEPLIVRAIHTALQSKLDRVILSTDSEQYAELGRLAGAETPFLRPAALASANTTAMSVIQHCLQFLDSSGDAYPDAVAYLQPTSPFRTAKYIDEGLMIMKTAETDTVLSLEPVNQFPAFMWEKREDGEFSRATPNLEKAERSQDQPSTYIESTCVVITRTGYLLNSSADGLIMNHNSFSPLFITPQAAIDINTEHDFAFAEFMAQRDATKTLATND